MPNVTSHEHVATSHATSAVYISCYFCSLAKQFADAVTSLARRSKPINSSHSSVIVLAAFAKMKSVAGRALLLAASLAGWVEAFAKKTHVLQYRGYEILQSI